MAIELPDLPYASNALDPFLSSTTMETHHGKHHRAYVDKLNGMIGGTKYADMALDDIVLESKKENNAAVFNNAAQIVNHTFLWHSMAPKSDAAPSGALRDAIDAAFGDLDGFNEAFLNAAIGQFGSGWVWLIKDGDKVRITSTGNAETPKADGLTPILTLDVWEHAYYIDYKSERPRYVKTYLADHVNWVFAEENFAA